MIPAWPPAHINLIGLQAQKPRHWLTTWANDALNCQKWRSWPNQQNAENKRANHTAARFRFQEIAHAHHKKMDQNPSQQDERLFAIEGRLNRQASSLIKIENGVTMRAR